MTPFTLYRYAYRLFHGLWETDGFSHRVFCLVNTSLFRVGCPLRWSKAVGKDSRATEARVYIDKELVTRFGLGFSRDPKRSRRTGWRVGGWGIVSFLFGLCSLVRSSDDRYIHQNPAFSFSSPSSFCIHCYPLQLSFVHIVTQLSRSSFLSLLPIGVCCLLAPQQSTHQILSFFPPTSFHPSFSPHFPPSCVYISPI